MDVCPSDSSFSACTRASSWTSTRRWSIPVLSPRRYLLPSASTAPYAITLTLFMAMALTIMPLTPEWPGSLPVAPGTFRSPAISPMPPPSLLR